MPIQAGRLMIVLLWNKCFVNSLMNDWLTGQFEWVWFRHKPTPQPKLFFVHYYAIQSTPNEQPFKFIPLPY